MEGVHPLWIRPCTCTQRWLYDTEVEPRTQHSLAKAKDCKKIAEMHIVFLAIMLSSVFLLFHRKNYVKRKLFSAKGSKTLRCTKMNTTGILSYFSWEWKKISGAKWYRAKSLQIALAVREVLAP